MVYEYLLKYVITFQNDLKIVQIHPDQNAEKNAYLLFGRIKELGALLEEVYRIADYFTK